MTEDMKVEEAKKSDAEVIKEDSTKKEEDTASESSASKDSSKDEATENKAGEKEEDSPAAEKDDKDKKDDEETAKKKKKEYANWPMKDIKETHDHDVLYGRGGGTNHHPGNKRYRKMVEERKLDYVNSKRLDKPLVALEIIKVWRSQEPPGRFLKMNEKNGTWNDVGDKKAREKTSQALREKAPELRRKQEEDALIKAGKDPNAIKAARAAAENAGNKSNRFGNGAKDQASLMRAHSLGQDFVPMGSSSGREFALDGFCWDPSQLDNIQPPPGGNFYPAGRHISHGSQGAGMPPQFPPSRNGSTVQPHDMPWDQQRQQSFGSTSSWARLPSGGAPPPPPYGSAPYAMRTNSFGRISREPSQQNPMDGSYYPPHPHSLPPPPPPPPPHGPGGMSSPSSSRFVSGGNSGTQKASKEPYALDPALAESWSKDYEKAAGVFGNMSVEQWTATAKSSSMNISSGMPRRDIAKRVTSNQNEDSETKPDLQANRTVKRAALNRDSSMTSNRLKAQYAPGTESNHPSKMKKPSVLEAGMRQMSITNPDSLDDATPEPLSQGGRTDTIDRIAREIMAETTSSSIMRPPTVAQGGRTLTEAMLADVMGPSITNKPTKPSSLTAKGRSLTEEIMMGEGPPPPPPQATNSTRPPSLSARSLTEEMMLSEGPPLPPSGGKRPPPLSGRSLTEDIMLEGLPPAPLPQAPLPPTNNSRPSALTLAGRGCTAEILAPIGDVHIMPQKKKKQPIPSRPPAIRTEGRMRTAEYFDLLNEPMGQDDAAALANPKETHWLQGAM